LVMGFSCHDGSIPVGDVSGLGRGSLLRAEECWFGTSWIVGAFLCWGDVALGGGGAVDDLL
jgi:hypothetical protein